MLEQRLLAIDIGTSQVKAFAGIVSAAGEVSIIGSGAMAAAGFAKGEITDLRLLAETIRQTWDCALVAANSSIDGVFLGVGGLGMKFVNQVMGSVAVLDSVGVQPEDIERVHRAAVVSHLPDTHKILHVLPRRYLLDGQPQAAPLFQKGAQLEVEANLVAVDREAVTMLLNEVEAAGIHVSGVFSNIVASAPVFPLLDAGANTLLIDMGGGLTDIALCRGGQLLPLASLPLGGEYITSDIMQGLNVSKSHAEAVKRYYAKLDKKLAGSGAVLDCNDYGTKDKHVPYDFLHNIIESRAEEIAVLVSRHIEPLLTESPPEKVLFTGGSALMPTIGEWLEACLHIPVYRSELQTLPAEYSYPENTACYGILLHAAKSLPLQDEGNNSWRSVVRRIKGFFNN